MYAMCGTRTLDVCDVLVYTYFKNYIICIECGTKILNRNKTILTVNTIEKVVWLSRKKNGTTELGI